MTKVIYAAFVSLMLCAASAALASEAHVICDAGTSGASVLHNVGDGVTSRTVITVRSKERFYVDVYPYGISTVRELKSDGGIAWEGWARVRQMLGIDAPDLLRHVRGQESDCH